MAFADRLAISGTCLFFWAEVDGVDAMWFNVTPPSNWTLTPTVYTTLSPPPTWQGLESRVEPFAGIAPSGRLSCVFRLPPTHALAADVTSDPWLDYVANDVTRGPITVLTADLSATGTTATVDDTTDFPSSGTLYIGAETATYSGKTSTTFTGLTRAKFNTYAHYHTGDLDQVYEVGAGGPYVTDRLFSLQGRRLRVYAGTGFLDANGALVAYGANEDADDNRLIFAGYVRDVQFDSALSAVSVTAESLRSALATECATRLPRAIAGGAASAFQDKIYLSDDNNLISWAWLAEGVPSGSDYDYDYTNTRLQRDDGGGGTENVPDGWYALSEVMLYVAFTIGGGTAGNGVSKHPDASGSRTIVAPVADALTCISARNTSEERGGRYHSITFEAELTSINYAFQLSGGVQDRQLWRELGYTSQQAVLAEYTSSTRNTWTLDADRLAAQFFLPRGRRARRLVYTQQGSLAFQTTTGFVDDDGSAVAAYARIGTEIVRIASVGTAGSTQVMVLAGRGQLGSEPAEIYVEDTRPYEPPDTVEIVQGVVLPGVSWGLAALQLAQSGQESASTYDTGWRGSGAGLDPSIFDAASWLEYGQARRDIARFEPFELDELLANEAVGGRCAIVEEQGTIKVKPTDPPLLVNAAGATALTTANLLTLGGPGVKMSVSEARIVNKIIATDVGYDPGADRAAEKITWSDGTSVGTWGASRPLTLSLRNVAGREAARASVLGLAQVAAASWSRPVYALDLSVALPEVGWTLNVLDEITITHPLILDRASPGRGVTSLSGRVYGIKPNWRGDGVAAMVRVIAYSTAQKFSAYAPTAYANTVDSTDVLLNDHYDSSDDDAKDATRFAAGYRVRLYKPGGDTAGAESRIVDSVTISGSADASYITLTVAPTLTPPFLVEFDGYDTSGIDADQLLWTYLSNGAGVVGSGTDKAFLYV